jgi:hypothetical protein
MSRSSHEGSGQKQNTGRDPKADAPARSGADLVHCGSARDQGRAIYQTRHLFFSTNLQNYLQRIKENHEKNSNFTDSAVEKDATTTGFTENWPRAIPLLVMLRFAA